MHPVWIDRTWRYFSWRYLVVAALAVALLAPLGPDADASPAELSDPPASSAATPPGTDTVGLITGDRVTVRRHSDGGREVDVELAHRPGGDVTYEMIDEAGQLYVIPSDAASLIPHRLDRELFNVTKLIDYGYDVAHGLPVIVMPKAKHDTPTVRDLDGEPGVRASTELSSIGAEAAVVASGRPAFWREVTDPGRVTRLSGSLADAGMIWLDEQIEVAIDESVPQVGAPEAWRRGYDGADTTVAVLDTGIDGDHPDLAGKVVDAQSFVPRDASPDDGYGHGTHVAGIIAGGDPDDDSHVGVAPGAKLLNGKVLDDNGSGSTSWIIDGMEWAAESGADVVNLSLGSNRPSNGFDLLSRATNELTAEHDVLFVVAAGNLGSGNWTISSPGAASSALTVGAVDRSDELAWFSSRGPRLVPELRHVIGGVFSIKPDITAPGVGIVSARARGTTMGTPLNARYTRASGTSMATPHVAGAAAILLQARPDLDPTALKASLVGTAEPNEALTVYQQGGGRLDVPAALDGSVTATPAPLDFGSFAHPYGEAEPVSQTVTYTNNSAEPLGLDLSLEVRSPESGAPGDSELQVVPDRLDLAAGESADVTVMLDPRSGEYGTYGGYLVATDDTGDVAHRVPTGYWLEPPMHTLTFEGIDRRGNPTTGPLDNVDVIDIEDLNTFRTSGTFYRSDGTITLEVPQGRYAIFGRFQDPSPRFGEELSIVTRPELEVTGDMTITLDARTAQRITVETPHRTEPLPHSDLLLGYHRRTESGQSFARVYSVDPTTPIYVNQADAPSTGELTVFSRWMLGGTDQRRRPVLYDLALVESDGIPSRLHYDLDRDDLARVENSYHSDLPDQVVRSTRFAEIPGWEGWDLGSSHEFNVPVRRTEYYVGGGPTSYRQRVNLNGSRFPTLFTEPTTYAAGERRSQSWFARPMAPGLRPSEPTVRAWNKLRVDASPWVDPGDNALEGDVEYSYFRDGELVSAGTDPTVLPMSDQPAEYRLELHATSQRSWWQTSPAASTVWTLQSTPPADGGPRVEPLLEIDYDVDLDLTNTLTARRGSADLGLRVSHQAGADAAAVTGAKLWTSYDGGETWRRQSGSAVGAGRYEFRLDPGEDDPVSLKVEAWDATGNRIEQTVVDAFRIANPKPQPPNGTLVRASLASDGSQANRGSSAPPAISADGRYVAFASIADNLAPGFSGGVFVRDLRTGTTERVSYAADGGPATGAVPAISADGRYVAFASSDDTLVADDTNEEHDVFVYDRERGETERVSVASDGTEGDDGASLARPAISADGRYVTFSGYASNLVDGDTNQTQDVFVHDRTSGTTERVSVASDGTQTPRFRSSSDPAISADGRYISFESSADNLVPEDTNNSQDIFVRDLSTGVTERVSIGGDGTEANGSTSSPAIDASGRYVAYSSWASNLVPGDTNGTGDVFVYDREAGTAELVSVASDGTPSDGYSSGPAISADGRYVGFPSGATTLVGGDTNEVWDLFVHDRRNGTTERASAAASGAEANGSSGSTPGLSADGSAVAFVSSASNLVRADTNGESDVFVRQRGRP